MKAERIRDEFEALAEKLGYTIRYEKGDFKGDACRIKSEQVIIINKLIPITHQNYAFSRIFASEDLSQMSILPILRSMIEEVGGGVEILFDEGEQHA
ncbi:MAG: hypothetical protein K9M55_02185 [Candidatus Marinimicrobia bacterium]|nr:hypothetical protein [Candidatus Neomarinimicrobiota bacterium]MCF7921487.1 hypothetical protein [Candidatus Neomarinimicrobiota bacterium]